MDQKLKVVMLSEYPCYDSEQGKGGILQSTFHLIEGFELLADPALELHLISQTPACLRAETRKLGPIVLHFVPKGASELDKFLLNPLRLLATTLRVRRRLRPHLIHGQGSVGAILLSQWLSPRNIQTIHGVFRNEHAALDWAALSRGRRLRIRMTAWLERYYLSRVRNLIAITSEIEHLVRDDTAGRARIFPTFIAIDPAFFAQREDRTDAGASRKILFVAAITPRKGLHFLLEAFDQIAESHAGSELRIVGMWDWAPEYVAELRQRYDARVKAGQVTFVGPVDRRQLFEEFAQAEMLVLPSLSESAPAVVSQAMCLGLPIVTTHVGGIPDMVEDNVTALMVPPADVESLRGALAKLLQDAPLRVRLGAAAREVALRRYHPKSVAAATRDAYRAVAGC